MPVIAIGSPRVACFESVILRKVPHGNNDREFGLTGFHEEAQHSSATRLLCKHDLGLVRGKSPDSTVLFLKAICFTVA
jgi:hypothetical protein